LINNLIKSISYGKIKKLNQDRVVCLDAKLTLETIFIF